MKKQLLIAASAATMSVSALADISITGAASATWTHTDFDAAATANTNVYAQDFDITITGTSGATTATVSLDIEDTDNVVAGEVGAAVDTGDTVLEGRCAAQCAGPFDRLHSHNIGPVLAKVFGGHRANGNPAEIQDVNAVERLARVTLTSHITPLRFRDSSSEPVIPNSPWKIAVLCSPIRGGRL